MSGASSYVYNASGQRVRKTTVARGTVDFLYDLGAHPFTEVSATGGWNRGEVYAGARHIATYSNGATGTMTFTYSDWLGTERVRTSSAGASCEAITSLPYGDNQVTSGSCGDPSPMHFTGKPRDTETGLDDFGARYYSNRFGRWLSADWSSVPVPVPYANLSNPQTLNLYAMVTDDPESFSDLDGHDVGDFILGVVNAVADDFAGTQRIEDGNSDLRSGQRFGDAISVVAGTVGAIAGAVADVTADVSSGGAALTAAPAQVAVVAVPGAAAVKAATNLLKSGLENTSSSAPYENTAENKEQMKQGNAPTGTDNHPVELHHEGQRPNGPVKEMTRTEHRLGENFKKNHPNTGQKPSQINRNQARQQKRKYWKDKANQPD